MLYFVPNAKSMTAEIQKEHGFDRLLNSVQHRETASGPQGSGILVADGSKSAEYVHFNADRQTWSPRFGRTSMVGTWNDQPVSPEQLARQQQVEGDQLVLLDGHRWQIPRLRKWLDDDEQIQFSPELPRVMHRSTSTGRFVLGSVIPQYRDLWERSLKIAESMFAQLAQSQAASLEDSEVELFVCEVLAANYRVDADVISHLQLLTPELTGAIVRAALDWDTLRAHLKNRLRRRISGGMSSASGNPPLIAD
jgi:hypothetical protein